jgi:hypothetical protein
METSSSDHVNSENLHREMQLRRETESSLDVPEVGRDSSERVTKTPDPIQLSGSLAEEKTLENQTQSPQPGIPMESVDNVDDAGLDSTRAPDWEVVKPTELPTEPGPSQFHNDRFGDERSLDRELEDKDLQQELIDREAEDFNIAAERGEDFSRPNSNEILDPYYRSGSDPSDPPSTGHSLDSFI